jgi:hypothetical protein
LSKFSGKATEFPILWDTEEPETSDMAEHRYPWKNKPPYIRVSRKISGRDQLSGIIFELFNIRYHKKHLRLWKKACKGEIGKQEYSYRSMRLEYRAMKKCKQFFKKNSLIFSTADDSNSKLHKRIMSLTSFREFFAEFQPSKETYFAKVYDERIVPFLLKKRDVTVNSENKE